MRAVQHCKKSSRRGGGTSVLGDFQNLVGQDPEEAALTLKLALFWADIALGTREFLHQPKLF